MSGETIHLIIRDTSSGLYATSPQAPGLVYGRSTLDELRADVEDVLAFHFDRPGPFTVVEHHERLYEVGERELVARLACDEHFDQRKDVFSRISRALSVPAQARSLVDQTPNSVGEVVFVFAVPSDKLGWIAAQLDPRGDAVNVAAAIADEFVFTIPFAHGNDYAQRMGLSAAALGYTDETTVEEILRTTPIVQPATQQHSVAV